MKTKPEIKARIFKPEWEKRRTYHNYLRFADVKRLVWIRVNCDKVQQRQTQQINHDAHEACFRANKETKNRSSRKT